MLIHALIALTLLQAPAQTPVPLQDEPLTLPQIVYPGDAKAARIQGTVQLQINVAPDGHVTEVHALAGPEQLRQAAIDAYSHATYRPILVHGQPAPAIIATSVDFTLSEAPPTTDQQVNAQFQPLHAHCQQLVAAHSPDALDACRQALAMSQRFSTAELEARAAAYNDLVLVLIAAGRKSPNLPEADTLADQAVALVDGAAPNNPHKPAVAEAYITRAEVRSLAGDLPGAASDCATAEETLTTLLQDQGKRDHSDARRDEVETERAASYRAQLHDTLLLHAIVLDRQHKTKEAKALRDRASTI